MINKEILEVLACPKCGGDLEQNGDNLICHSCGLSYPIIDGIPMLLVEEADEI
jgi:uncharacterized protein YbaR (Trm112 family)